MPPALQSCGHACQGESGGGSPSDVPGAPARAGAAHRAQRPGAGRRRGRPGPGSRCAGPRPRRSTRRARQSRRRPTPPAPPPPPRARRPAGQTQLSEHTRMRWPKLTVMAYWLQRALDRSFAGMRPGMSRPPRRARPSSSSHGRLVAAGAGRPPGHAAGAAPDRRPARCSRRAGRRKIRFRVRVGRCAPTGPRPPAPPPTPGRS